MTADERASQAALKGAINPLPQSAVPSQAALPVDFTFALRKATKQNPVLLTFGQGNFGQFGLGEDDKVVGELNRPKLHSGYADLLEDEKLGPKGIVDVEAAGGPHTLVADSEGKVWSHGGNDQGSLGRQTVFPLPGRAEGSTETLPTSQFEFSPAIVEGLEGMKVVRVYAGDSASVALSDKGEIRSWGSFRVGFLSLYLHDGLTLAQGGEGGIGFSGKAGDPNVAPRPVIPAHLESVRFSAVATGMNHILALDLQGNVWAWGSGEQGNVGRKPAVATRHTAVSTLTPAKLHLKNIVTIGAGSFNSFAVAKDGRVFVWGLNKSKQYVYDIQ